jgi:hypothetical protein
MRNLVTAMATLAIALTFGPTIASAQNTINLMGSASTLTFTGESSASTIGLTLGTLCPNQGQGLCKAEETGGPSGHYSITGSAAITLTLTNSSAGEWSVSQTGPLTFSFCSNAGCAGVGNIIYLSGDLQLEDIVQSPGAKVGMFNYTEQVNLANLTGTLAASWGSGGIVDLNLKFASHTNIESLLNEDSTHKVKNVKIGSGTLDPTPEPGSMLLFGSGLLALGMVLRRRLLLT